jgi:3-dehydroquinate synthase
MIIKSNIRDYSVTIEKNFNFISGLLKSENAFFVVDKIVFEIYKEKLFQSVPAENIFLIEALETNKTIETALEICEVMTSIPAKRNARLISFGGGIIQDITGFAANILYRGIHWTFVPTTLLAGCDSCIGGKTSLNYKKYKNLLGTFYPPDAIFICSEFFNTLLKVDWEKLLNLI